jgi:hypothetical protein
VEIAVLEMTWAVHADDLGRALRPQPWGSMPKGTGPYPHPGAPCAILRMHRTSFDE